MEDQDILYHLCIYFLDYIHHIFGLSTNLWMAVSMRFLLGAISGIFDQVQAYATEVYRKECQTWALFAAPNRSFRGDFINYNVSIQSIWSSWWLVPCLVADAIDYYFQDKQGDMSSWNPALCSGLFYTWHSRGLQQGKRNYEGGDGSTRFGGPIGRAPREFGGDEGGAPSEYQPQFKPLNEWWTTYCGHTLMHPKEWNKALHLRQWVPTIPHLGTIFTVIYLRVHVLQTDSSVIS